MGNQLIGEGMRECRAGGEYVAPFVTLIGGGSYSLLSRTDF